MPPSFSTPVTATGTSLRCMDQAMYSPLKAERLTQPATQGSSIP